MIYSSVATIRRRKQRCRSSSRETSAGNAITLSTLATSPRPAERKCICRSGYGSGASSAHHISTSAWFTHKLLQQFHHLLGELRADAGFFVFEIHESVTPAVVLLSNE